MRKARWWRPAAKTPSQLSPKVGEDEMIIHWKPMEGTTICIGQIIKAPRLEDIWLDTQAP